MKSNIESLANYESIKGSEPIAQNTKIRSAAFIANSCVPYTLEIPENITDPRPLLILDGFGAKKWAYDGLRRAVAELGKPAISVAPPKTHVSLSYLCPGNLFHPEKLLSKAAWGVVRDIREHHKLSDRLDVDEFDGVGHSMGGTTLINLIKAKPGVMKNAILLQSAGLEDHHNTLDFAFRAPGFFYHEFAPAILKNKIQDEKGRMHSVKSELTYLTKYPERIIREGLVVSNADKREDLRELRLAQSIGVAAILGSKDTLLPPEKTLEHSADLFDTQMMLDGGHLLPQIEPKKVAQAIIDTLSELNSKRSIDSNTMVS